MFYKYSAMRRLRRDKTGEGEERIMRRGGQECRVIYKGGERAKGGRGEVRGSRCWRA